MESIHLEGPKHNLPIYIGDDVTDEDAFHVLKDRGTGILVGYHGHPTQASFKLKSTYEVYLFLDKLTTKVLNNKK